jgi:WG containing repeat
MKTLFYGLLLLTAQTLRSQSVVETKYANGVVKTRYHIHQKDTFLVETYYQNGQLAARKWRDDSTHLYNIGEIGRLAKEYGRKKQVRWIEPHFSGYWDALSRDSVFEYYPDGKIQKRYFWADDSIFNRQVFLTNGQLLESNYWKLNQDSSFSYYSMNNGSQYGYTKNAKTHKSQNFKYENYKLYSKFDYDQNAKNSMVEQAFFDTLTGQPIFIWKRDSQGFHPDKDPILCLYGFRDNADNWVVPPQYESVTHFNKIYFIVEKQGKYGVMNRSGQWIVPMEWDLLEDLTLASAMVFERISVHDFNNKLVNALPNAIAYLVCRKGNKYGIIDNNGKIILKPVYQGIREKKDDLFEVKIGGFWGVVDKNGKIVVEPKYSGVLFTRYDDLFISMNQKPIAKATEETMFLPRKYHLFFDLDYLRENGDTAEVLPSIGAGDFGLVHRNGQILLNPSFSAIRMLKDQDRYFWVRSNYSHEIGLFHAERGWLVDTQAHHNMNVNRYVVTTDPKKKAATLYGLIAAPDAKMVLPFDYQVIKPFEKKVYDAQLPQTHLKHAYKSYLFFLCQKEGKWGIYDFEKQNWAIPLKYDDLKVLSDSVFLAAQGGKWQFINLQERILLPDVYESAGIAPFSYRKPSESAHNYWADYQPYPYFVQKGNKLFFYNPISFPFTISVIECQDADGKNFFVTTTFQGNSLIYNRAGDLLYMGNDTIVARDGSYVALQNKATKMVQIIDNQGNKKSFSTPYFILNLQGNANTILVKDTIRQKIGALNLDGKEILPCNYFGVMQRDSQGVIWAKKEVPTLPKIQLMPQNAAKSLVYSDKNWQMFDENGKLLSPLYFDYPFAWQNALAIGQVDGKQGLWNHKGKVILPPQYDKIWYDGLSKTFHLFKFQSGQPDKVGFANADGQLIIDAILSNMSVFTQDYALVESQAGHYGVVRRNGQYLIPPKPNALQQRNFDLVALLDGAKDSMMAKRQTVQNYVYKVYNYEHYDYLFQKPYLNYDTGETLEIKIKQLDTLQRRILHNLMLEQMIENYFLNPTEIELKRNTIGHFADASLDKISFGNYEHMLDLSGHIVDFAITTKGISFFSYTKSQRKSGPLPNYAAHNFKIKNNIWQKQHLESVLFLTESNKSALNKLLIKKLSEVKNEYIDCGDPSSYFQKVQNRFYILDEGLTFFIPKYENSDFEHSIPFTLTWDDLQPFLK